MTRGVGEFAVQDLLPDWTALVAAFLTQLGDLWFLAVVLGAVLWVESERTAQVGVVAGLTLAGVGLYRGLKLLFALSRPSVQPLDPASASLPAALVSVWELTGTATGYGFPSGHATAATIVYVGLAAVLTTGTRRARVALAGVLVTTVGLSRVVLGVHFLVDVLAGTALGGGVVAITLGWPGLTVAQRGTASFGLAVAAGVFYLLASGVAVAAVAVLVGALAGLAGWQLIVRPRHADPAVPGV